MCVYMYVCIYKPTSRLSTVKYMYLLYINHINVSPELKNLIFKNKRDDLFFEKSGLDLDYNVSSKLKLNINKFPKPIIFHMLS